MLTQPQKTANEQPGEKAPLLTRLAAADRRWQREKGRVFWLRSVPVLLGMILVAFGADAFLQLGAAARIAWICSGIGLALVAAAVGWYVGNIRRNPPERTARFLEMRDPELGSRLINGLQLSAQSDDPTLNAGTRVFAHRAVERYDSELSTVDLVGLSRTGDARKALRWTAWAALLFLALLAAFYPVVKIVAPRFVDPLGDHPPYAFTQIQITSPDEAGVDVTYGAALPVKVEWSGHEPRELFVTVYPEDKPDQRTTLPMIRDGARSFFQEIADVRSNLVIIAHAKDWKFLSKQRHARVILTPKIDRAFLEIAPPAYTGLPAQERPFSFNATSALEGSELRFRLHSNRPLREGKIAVLREGQPAAPVALSLSGTYEVSGTVMVQETARMQFEVTDVDGLVSVDRPETLVSVTHDLPPAVRVVEPEQDGFVSVAFPITAKFQATDDYGVRTMRIHMGVNGQYHDPKIVTVEGIQREVSEGGPVNLQDLGAKPGDTVSFFAEAIDTAPNPHLSRSQTVSLRLISEEEYNDYLREEMDVRMLSEKYEDLLNRFDALRDEQVKLAEEAERLATRRTDPATKTPQFDALTARQNEINQRLNQLAGEMDHFVREKPVYDFEKGLDDQLKNEAKEIKQATALNDLAMKEIVGQTKPEGGDRTLSSPVLNQLGKEARRHAEALGARKESIANSTTKPLEDLSQLHDMVNDFNLFEQLYNAQKELAEQTAAYGKKRNLSREDQLALKELASREDAIRDALSQLPDMLRKHAENGGDKFPKAAKSCKSLADAIEQGRLSPQAAGATQNLLEGDGENSAALTSRLEGDMQALFSKCNGQGPGDDELDQFLSLKMPGGNPGQSFEQMKKSRRFGLQSGRGFGLGGQRGLGSSNGYSMSSSDMPVFGGEQLHSKQQENSHSSAKGGAGKGTSQGAPSAPQMDTPDVLKNRNATHQPSGVVQSESSIEQYREVVEEYFKRVTEEKTKPGNPKKVH